MDIGTSGDTLLQEEASAKALRQTRDYHVRSRDRRTVYWELEGRQEALEMRSKREVRKALRPEKMFLF